MNEFDIQPGEDGDPPAVCGREGLSGPEAGTMRRQMDPAEVMQLLKKLQDPHFRRQARLGLQFVLTLATGMLSFVVLTLVLALALKALTPALVVGSLTCSALIGWGAGVWLTRRALMAFQARIAEKTGLVNLFGDL